MSNPLQGSDSANLTWRVKFGLIPPVCATVCLLGSAFNDLHQELITIDENIVRRRLTDAQEAVALARRKVIHETLHPETRVGAVNQHTVARGQNGHEQVRRFTQVTSEATGRAERQIQRAVRRAEKLGPDIEKVAAASLGIEVPIVDFDGPDPLAFVIARNLHRRHLTEIQRGMVATRLATLTHGGARRGAADQDPNLDLEGAAKLLNVSRATVATARAVQRDAVPELQRAVEQGEFPVLLEAKVSCGASCTCKPCNTPCNL